MAATRTPVAPVQRRRIEYKWLALSVVTLGAAMSAIDSSIVILGLPSMIKSLHSDLVTMVWVIMGYILMNTIFLGLFGRLADMFGRVRMYNLGFIVFTAGSLLCALANSGTILVSFRLVQGVGAAMLMANSMAIITEAFPSEERGRAMGINAITWAIGGIVGPVLGGVILGFTTWRWIFLVNLPIGIGGTIWGYLALHEMSRPEQRERLDVLGSVLLSGGLVCLLVALTESVSWGWASPRFLLLLAGFLVLEALFFLREQRTRSPLVDLSLFSSRIFSFTVAATTLETLAMFAVNFLVIFYLQGVKGVAPLQAALMVLPLSLTQSIAGPIGGVISDRAGARLPASCGLIVQSLACLILASLSPTSGYGRLLLGLVILGAGGGLVWSAQTSAVMGAAPVRRLGIGGGDPPPPRQCGMVTSFALALAVAAATIPQRLVGTIFLGTGSALGGPVMSAFSGGMRHALLVSGVIVVLAAAMTIVAGDTAAAHRASAGAASPLH